MSDLFGQGVAAPRGRAMNKDKPRICEVYNFTNGMTMVFDQRGQQMPQFQGRTTEVISKIGAAGWTGTPAYGAWQVPK